MQVWESVKHSCNVFFPWTSCVYTISRKYLDNKIIIKIRIYILPANFIRSNCTFMHLHNQQQHNASKHQTLQWTQNVISATWVLLWLLVLDQWFAYLSCWAPWNFTHNIQQSSYRPVGSLKKRKEKKKNPVRRAPIGWKDSAGIAMQVYSNSNTLSNCSEQKRISECTTHWGGCGTTRLS